MATAYKSEAAVKGYIVRPTSENKQTFSATCVVPAGTVLAAGDTFDFFSIGENVDIESLTIRNSDFDDGTDCLIDFGYVGGTNVLDFFVDGEDNLQAASIRTYASDADHGEVFTDGIYAPSSSVRLLRLTIDVPPTTQTTADNSDRSITVAGTFFRAVPVSNPNEVYTPPSP
jgi:hypothetical protein